MRLRYTLYRMLGCSPLLALYWSLRSGVLRFRLTLRVSPK